MNEESKNIDSDCDVFGRKRKNKANKASKKSSSKKNLEEKQTDQASRDGPSQENVSDEPSKKKVKIEPEEEPKRPAVVSQVLRGINVTSFAEARALEISNTLEALKEAASMEGKRVFQRVPRHMRRRPASHNRKRIPRRLRSRAAEEEKKGTPAKKSKMPSRKHRRRPKNLLEEYNRRKKNNAWLETHIWHAKRFKMIEKWGYKLAEQLCDKGFRSTYRASAHGCIMQDISYHGCIELIGSQNMLLEGLEHHKSKETGAKIIARSVLSGEAESSFIFYHYDSFPRKAIGPVSLLWKPAMNEEEVTGNNEKSELRKVDSKSERTLWIWCHPACHDELVESLRITFEKTVSNGSNLDDVSTAEKEKPDISDLEMVENVYSRESQVAADVDKKAESKEIESTKPKVESEKFCIANQIRINSYKLDFAKIRLTGPFSHKILVNNFQLHDVKGEETKGDHWWQRYYKDPYHSNMWKESIKTWKVLEHVQSTAELPPRVVLGLTVVDPRLNIPEKKTWPMKEMKEKQEAVESVEKTACLKLLKDWQSNLSYSPIWNYDIRQEVKNNKLCEADLNTKRSQQLDIGERLGIEEDTSRIPVLLVQRPGAEDNIKSSMSHYGSGWDLIIPSGWAMAFWVSLVYRGAHVGGQREERSIYLEMKSPCFPKEFPDTAAGRQFLEEERQKKQEKHARYPPNKRPNYEKLGVVDPFGFPWQSLVDEWIKVYKDILQFRDLLPVTQSSGDSTTVDCRAEGQDEESMETVKVETCRSTLANSSAATIDTGDGFYVLRDLKILYSIKDILLRRKKNISISKSESGGEISAEKQSLLASLLSKHSKAIMPVSFLCLGKGEVTDDAIISIPTKDDLKCFIEDAQFGGPTEPLHRGLKSLFPAIADQFNIKRTRAPTIGLCTRWTIGYVTSGRYSLTCGRSAGLGFVNVAGFVACLLMQGSCLDGCVVLLRNNNSQQYRLARIDVAFP